jgi:hypothetical protein
VSLIKLFLAGNALLEFQDFQEFIAENTPNAEVFPAKKSLIGDIPGFPSPCW